MFDKIDASVAIVSDVELVWFAVLVIIVVGLFKWYAPKRCEK